MPHAVRPALSLLLVLSTSFAWQAAPRAAESPESALRPEAFLVRHAEKESGDDPVLSAAGSARAEVLARRLAGLGIERVLSTDTRRTRQTAGPLAERLGLEVEIYDPRALDELAARLREDGRRVLVVGHSNTTPQLVGLLGGEPGEPIPEDEYGRLYRVDLETGETVVEHLPGR